MATVAAADRPAAGHDASRGIALAGWACECGVTSSTFYNRFRRYSPRLASSSPASTSFATRRRAAAGRDRASIESVSQLFDHSSLAVTTVYLRRLEGQEDLAVTGPVTWARGRGMDFTGAASGCSIRGRRGASPAPCRARQEHHVGRAHCGRYGAHDFPPSGRRSLELHADCWRTSTPSGIRGVCGKKTENIWRPGRIRNLIVNPVYAGNPEFGRRARRAPASLIVRCSIKPR